MYQIVRTNQSKLFGYLDLFQELIAAKKKKENQFDIQKTRINAKDGLIIFLLGQRPVAEKTSSLTDRRFKRQHHEEMAFPFRN